jgi:hypothetical protein
MIGVKMLPDFIGRYWAGMPRTGIGALGVKIGSAVVLGSLTKMLTKSQVRANQVVVGALASVMLDLYDMYLAPKIGMPTVTAPVGVVAPASVTDLRGFLDTPPGVGLGQYQQMTPVEYLAS